MHFVVKGVIVREVVVKLGKAVRESICPVVARPKIVPVARICYFARDACAASVALKAREDVMVTRDPLGSSFVNGGSIINKPTLTHSRPVVV